MNSNKLVAVLLLIVIGVSLLPVVGEMVNNANIVSTTENFTAVNDDLTAETITTSETIYEVNQVTVNGVALTDTDYTFTGNTITLDAGVSTTDDSIAVNYDYETDLGTATTSLLNLLPILFVVLIVGGAVKYVKFN